MKDTLDLANIVNKYVDRRSNKKARHRFLNVLNKSIKDSLKHPQGNVTFGEFSSDTHSYEFQIVLRSNLEKLSHLAMLSNFSMSRYINQLSLFLHRAFIHNKLAITFHHSHTLRGSIQPSVSVHLDDPRRYSPKNQNGLKIWLQFKIVPGKAKTNKTHQGGITTI